MKAYYGSRFSPNMTATPEGFLICHSVPIARTGWYEYLGEEIGAEPGKIIRVYRSPEEVFSPAAMASFEGKILSDEHPPELVTPDNATRYARGAVQNVRQGSGTNSDLLLADLVVHDQTLINEIQEGKREVSCGYDCMYEPMDDGTYQQKNICGNHVAVVKKGRAGDRVAIKDSKTQITEGEKKMPKINLPKVVASKDKSPLITKFLAAVGLKHFATDAEPEEVMEAVDAMVEEMSASEGVDPERKPEGSNDQDPAVQALMEQVARLTEIVTKLAESNTKPETSPEDAIDAEIAKLEGEQAADDEEESHTIPVEHMDEEGPVSDPEDRPKSLTGDNAYKVAALRAIKPIIAAISDPAERKRAADAAIASFKGKPARNTYASINSNRTKPVADKKPATVDHSQLGRDIAKKYNPHFKNRS
ncbi:hypothetical protein AV654_17710 [Paenibacillus elgii]|uniref:DUF2213 domain-containing protein n=1 Tax=Paenibacillus elgii TaxID=189691 RepID=A0A161SEL4_9BACL|nr:DUF2213 domain-containing protein [Paenibacillus elgii]KZE79305.1 hypothetical protein AV654_17710 [Paenibacillus elgii]